VDAKHADQQLDDRQEARRQVGFADQIFISKTDLVGKDEVDALMHRIKHMNPRAPQTAVHFGDVPIKDVFDLRGFNLNAKLDIDPDFLKEETRTITTMPMGMTTITTTSMASTATTRTTTPTTTT
jgi:G3E family GTPase